MGCRAQALGPSSHPPLPSQATAESWTGRGATGTESGVPRCRRRISQVSCDAGPVLTFIGMAQSHGWVKRYFKAFCKGFFVAVPVAVTFLDQVACVARVEGASMQPSLNPGGSQSSDVVLLNHWKVRNFEVQRGDIVSLV
uniref:Mitochondrial inner membrane protease subunit 2 n=1 Tax=Oryctolagus cuniculus TaxID=9986 RepID=A0A5F9CX19_RABIT